MAGESKVTTGHDEIRREWFDRNALAFVYQEETKAGDPSRFSKLVSRDSVKA